MTSAAQFITLIEKSENAGFIHMKLSNFGKPGYFSIHNSNYRKYKSAISGLGRLLTLLMVIHDNGISMTSRDI